MIALVMCGGRGSRMRSDEEKLLLKYKIPLVQNVINSLHESGCFTKVICVTSKNAPQTREFVANLGVSTFETSGDGYVKDLNQAMKNFNDMVFVTSADMPLLDGDVIRKLAGIGCKEGTWTSVLVSKKFLDLLGMGAEYLITINNSQYAYTGISVVDSRGVSGLEPVKESYVILDDKRIAVNINTKKDLDLLDGT